MKVLRLTQEEADLLCSLLNNHVQIGPEGGLGRTAAKIVDKLENAGAHSRVLLWSGDPVKHIRLESMI